MSDNSDYYSESDSDESENSEKITTNNKLNKNILPKFKQPNNIQSYEDDEEEESDIDETDSIIQEGGVDDIEIASVEENDDNKEEDEDEEEDDDEYDDVSDNDDKDNDENKNVVKSKKTVKPAKPEFILEDEEEEDDEYDENYLQKFSSEVTKNYVHNYHPECLIHNYDEVEKLTKVIRNNDNIIVDPLHKTIPFLTKYEKARVLGQRAKQIETGAKPFIKVPENIIDGYIIAELELQQKKIPFIIKRPINGGFEYWNIKDLEIISF
jgi:DNA-directed RNA polymerase subunit K/omega